MERYKAHQFIETNRMESKTNLAGRRKFLKRTASGLAISSLPAQSVWGACNASGISGGSRAINIVCKVPNIKGGYSHGTWDKFVVHREIDGSCIFLKANGKEKDDSNILHKFEKVFGTSGLSNEQLEEKCCLLTEFFKRITISVGVKDYIEGVQEFTIYDAFVDNLNGDRQPLAAMWLNVYFGLATTDSVYSDAHDIVSEFWTTTVVNEGPGKGQANISYYEKPGNMDDLIEDTYSYSGTGTFDNVFDYVSYDDCVSCRVV